MDVISNAIKSYDNSFSYRIGQACVWRIVYADQITLLIVLVYLVCRLPNYRLFWWERTELNVLF